MAQYLANDKYSAKLRTVWVYDPPDSTLAVDAVPQNVPTIVVVGYNTEFETVFTVTGKSGSSSADYTLTGVSRLRGYEGNLASGLSVTCLNNEEFFNQWGTSIAELQEVVDGTNKTVEVTKVLDINGNEVIETPATTSAVNQIKVTNATTGNNPTIEASGDDTSIPLLLKGKSASPRVGGTYNLGNLTGSVTINCKNGTRQKGTLTGNVTITLSNPQEGEALELFLFQDSTGGRTISFDTTIVWQDDTTPTFTTTASKLNSIVLRYIGSAWYGMGAKFAS